MIDLNNSDSFKQLDPKDVFGSTGLFSAQCEQIWKDSKSLSFPSDYSNFDSVVLCGMGGSAYAGYVIESLFKNELKVPFISNNDYDLPTFVDKNTLVLLSSYSGSTEESLTAGAEAFSKGVKVTGITNGGKLGELLKQNNAPFLMFDAKYNPSGQPRLGTGYMVLGTIALLSRMGLLKLSDPEVSEAIDEVNENQRNIIDEAKELAKELLGYFPIIMSSGFLNGNAHILRNQFNETSKTFSAFEDIPELNHHLMEGFKYPDKLPARVLLLSSNLYDLRHLKRLDLTKDVINKNNIKTLTYSPRGTTKLSQSLNALSFGGYVTFFLGILYGEDPSLIPWVDYFKEQLANK